MVQKEKNRFICRKICCPRCEAHVGIPVLWITGFESIFRCPSCGLKFRTGYKMGAFLFALALVAAVVTANIAVYVLSSAIYLYAAIAIIPLWIFYGFVFRKAWLSLKVFLRKRALLKRQKNQK